MKVLKDSVTSDISNESDEDFYAGTSDGFCGSMDILPISRRKLCRQ
jgi:hypothetical protein